MDEVFFVLFVLGTLDPVSCCSQRMMIPMVLDYFEAWKFNAPPEWLTSFQFILLCLWYCALTLVACFVFSVKEGTDGNAAAGVEV